MTLFKSEHRTYMMCGDVKTSRSRGATKRPSSTPFGSVYDLDYECYQENYYDRGYDYQRVPTSLVQGPSPSKRPRSSSISSGHRHSRDRPPSKSSRAQGVSNRTKLKLEELQGIKKELTQIKTQVDGLLDSLDRMDTQKRDHTGSPLRDSLEVSLHPLSTSSPEHSTSPSSPRSPHHRIQRESPELGEASDDSHTMNNQSSGPEDEI